MSKRLNLFEMKNCLVLTLVSLSLALSMPQSAISKDDPDWEPEPLAVPKKNSTSVESPTNSKVETKDGRTVLKLGVEHSSSLSPVSDSLQAGSIFDNKLLNEGSDKLIWYPIPKWLAGKWRRAQETTVFSHDYASGWSDNQQRTFMSEQVADFGVQTDKKGTVWNCNLGSRGVSDRGSYRSVALVMGKAPVETTSDSIIFREVFTVANVNKTTNVILDSYLAESITRHRRRPDGSLETSMSVKIYNASGIPRQVQENISNDRLVSAYEEVDTYKGRDIKADFTKFLKDKGLGQLVPN
ncbi:MAG: hypothetical protein SGJ27_27695 [Candidatus Melainabacteria bacterium]|nr:hypothetical protein [Candidatus Melainabacteria bacterium]